MNINCADHNGRRPIHLAVACRQPEAVKLLLEADCSLATPDYSNSLLQVALGNGRNYDHITNLVIDALIDRHSRLARLALLVLPDDSAVRIEIQDDILNESLAPKIEQALTAHNYRIPASLELDRDGERVYDTSDPGAEMRLTVPLADKLWRGGFRFTDEAACFNGLTPILQSWLDANFEMVAWFINKGASPYSKHRDTMVSGLHLFSKRVSYPGGYFRDDVKIPDNPEHLKQLINEEGSNRDSCACICTIEGCTPLTIVLKHAWPYLQDWRSIRDKQPSYRLLLSAIKKWQSKLIYRPTDDPQHQSQLLRILVFEKMRLQHTCCNMVSGAWLSWEEKGREIYSSNGNVQKFHEALVECERKMSSCYCAIIEKPLCAVFHDSCRAVV